MERPYPRDVKCLQCNKIVDKAPCRTVKYNNSFCDRGCYLKAIQRTGAIGKNRKRRVTCFNCLVCNKLCEKKMYSVGSPRYCSSKCYGKDFWRIAFGPKHWNWKGGKNTRYMAKTAPRPRPEVCEICNRKGKGRNGIVLDHNHKTMQFRGWLCSNCNTAIGLADENVEILKALIKYINENSF